MEEKYALITGGTKGIGKAVAATLVNAGYHVLLTYASDDTAANTIRKQLGEEKADVLKADVTSADAIQTIYSFLTNKQKCLDTVILNAGLTCRDSFENLSLADWERVFFANIHFPVFLLQKLVNGKKINQNGSVVFTGSLMGIHPHSVSLAYGVTKSGVQELIKNLVKFMEPYGIRVNGVAPGFVDTEWQKTKPAEIRHNIENKVASHRFCEPEEVANVYKMLIENQYFNGEIVVVDGAYSYK